MSVRPSRFSVVEVFHFLAHLLLHCSVHCWKCFLTVSLTVPGLCCWAWSLSGGDRGLLSAQCMGFSLWWLLLLQTLGSKLRLQHLGWSSCGSPTQARLGNSVVHQLEQGSVTLATLARGLRWLWHMGSSWSRDQICAPCIGRSILYHWTTREGLCSYWIMSPTPRPAFKSFMSFSSWIWGTCC